jgi:hypothetical protein
MCIRVRLVIILVFMYGKCIRILVFVIMIVICLINRIIYAVGKVNVSGVFDWWVLMIKLVREFISSRMIGLFSFFYININKMKYFLIGYFSYGRSWIGFYYDLSYEGFY